MNKDKHNSKSTWSEGVGAQATAVLSFQLFLGHHLILMNCLFYIFSGIICHRELSESCIFIFFFVQMKKWDKCSIIGITMAEEVLYVYRVLTF